MKPTDELQTRRPLRVSLAFLMLALVTLAAVLGWYSARLDYLELKSENAARESLLHAATVEARGALDFDIVGEPIDDHALIQALGFRRVVPAAIYLDQWHEERKRYSYTFPDRFGNQQSQWEKIDRTKNLVCYCIVLADEPPGTFGRTYHDVCIFVQDGIIRLITETQSILHS